jgi:uncharacterized Zn finger protein
VSQPSGDGCPICHEAWQTSGTIADRLGVSPRLQTYLYRCVDCGTFWEQVVSHHARPIPASEAAAFLALADFEPY